MAETTIVIVDENTPARAVLATLLQAKGFKVRLFDSAVAFLGEYAQGEANCIISAMRLPDMDGFALQLELAKHKTHLPVIILTGGGDISLAVRAMKAGAIDFIELPFDEDRLLASVKLCLDQGRHARQLATASQDIERRLASLTPREREVLEHLIAGDPNKVMAHNLDISPRTLEVHRGHLMGKMQARSLADLVRMALAAGLGDTRPTHSV